MRFSYLLWTLLLFPSCMGCNKDNIGKLGLNSGASSSEVLFYLPDNTDNVTVFNPANLLEKMDYEGMKKNGKIQLMNVSFGESKNQVMEILENIDQLGFDLKKDIFSISYPMNADGKKIDLTIFEVADVQALEQSLTKLGFPKAEDASGFKLMQESNQNALGYNDKLFLSASTNRTSQTDWQAIFSSFFNAKEAGQLVKDEDFMAFLQSDHDIINWRKLDELAEDAQLQSGSSMAGISSSALKGNSLKSHFDFEKGVVKGLSSYKINDELAGEIGGLFKDEVSTDFQSYILKANINTALSVAFDLEGVVAALDKRPQARDFADGFLEQVGLSLEAMTQILDGDIMFSYFGEGLTTGGTFAAKIKNTSLLQEQLDNAVKSGGLVLNDGIYRLKFLEKLRDDVKMAGYLYLDDDVLLISHSDAFLKRIQNGTLKDDQLITDADFEPFVGHLFGTYLKARYVNSLLDGVDLSTMDYFNASLDRTHMEFDAEMKNQAQNSLKTLVESWMASQRKAFFKEED